MTSLFRLVILCGLALAVTACGKKNALVFPVALDQVTPWTEDGQRAIDPPRDDKGRVIEPQSKPRPTPAFKSTPFDVILN